MSRSPLTRGPSPLVERELELERLSAAVEDAAAGRGRTVAVVGEPGIGKSSLLAGARLMGFTGLLFAIPVASVLRVLISELVAWYRGTFFYTATPATDADAVDVAVVEAHMPPPRSARATNPEPDGTLPRDREPLMSLEDASKRTTVVQGTPGAGPRE